LAEQNPKSKRTVVVDMKKNIMMSPGRAPSVATASKYGGTTAHGDDDLDEEFEYMLQGKAQLEILQARRKKAVEKKVENMEKRQQKMNTQLIEMFAKKELQFMNQYMKNSTTAINNGDKMNSDDF
jgi:ABC-type siderophore export system fused ATPase/permease subunit